MTIYGKGGNGWTGMDSMKANSSTNTVFDPIRKLHNNQIR